MALSDRWSLSTLRAVCRRELMDPASRFWADIEIDDYLNDWQYNLQAELELVFSTATTTIGAGTSTFSYTDIASDIYRPSAIYWNNVRLAVRTKEDLDLLHTYWREATPASPYILYIVDSQTFGLWPTPATSGELNIEYAVLPTLSESVDMVLPAWVRYSAKNYVGFRAYLRFGPNQDTNRAYRYKAKFFRQVSRYKDLKMNFLPAKYLSLRPGGEYEKSILDPTPYGDVALPAVITMFHSDEVPSGAVNGINTVFVLAHNPDPDISLKVWVDGVLLIKDTHYTLSGTTITFYEDYRPLSGQSLFATYRYTS